MAGLHLEDQVNPKRCGHLDGKDVVDRDTAVKRIKAAVSARRDPGFVIAARTDAAAVNGLDDAIDRARAYADAGADLIFPEAMAGEADFERLRAAIDVPILANMTEFGKSPLLTVQTLENLGVNVVIYPVTLLRLAMQAADAGLAAIAGARHPGRAARPDAAPPRPVRPARLPGLQRLRRFRLQLQALGGTR